MSPAPRDESGIPRIRRRVVAPPSGGSAAETWPGANQAKADKLRRKSLQRRAGASGLELRHSAYGYALIDTTRKPVNDRNNMTLDEIERLLDRRLEQ